jgi:arylsulfatase A-like enzyme
MAAEGVQMERAFTCQPVCAPARACLQTGLYATAAEVWRDGIALPQRLTTLADCFNAGGYDTGYIGKWHLATTDRAGVRKRGLVCRRQRL